MAMCQGIIIFIDLLKRQKAREVRTPAPFGFVAVLVKERSFCEVPQLAIHCQIAVRSGDAADASAATALRQIFLNAVEKRPSVRLSLIHI